ncbi:TIGR03546 family protein [Thalassotalea sp. M1531]|uniref:TIGR03546 family protein n=1 Tax=Thalassotalea algicola TaxID=2716224 RepID=A0A7Y0LDN1_9GAMM|nr:TIGR03546 family protein [Thalassotalea algicola]NMP32232.1 TIGR03546 family protein [Thalassotalea algicola]
MLSLLAQLLKALNSENSSRQVSAAIALSLLFALSPILSLQALLILLLVLMVKVHLASFIIGATLFEGLAFILSPVSILIGEMLLTSSSTSAAFESLYQFGWFKLGQWHHTYNLGSLVLGAVLAVPVYFLTKLLVLKYRQHIKNYFERLAIVKALKATRVFQLYQQFGISGDK